MAVEYEIASDIAVISEVANTNQLAHVAKFYTGAVTYDDEASSKFATVTIGGKSQRVMLCIAVNGTVNYDDVPCKYSTVDGHRCLNVVEPNGTETPDDVPSVYETMVVDGKTVRAIRCVLINQTPIYDGVSSVCTFVDSGKTHTAQLVNVVGAGSIEVIVKGVPPLVLPDAIAGDLVSLKAFGGTEQRNLPDGYIERQFIYMMDGSYLLTDIVPTFAGHYELEIQTTSVTASAATYLGGRDESIGNGGLRFAHISDGRFRVSGFGALSTSSGTAANNTKYKFIWDNGSFWVYSGTTLIHSGTFTEESTPSTTPLAINGWNSGGTIGENIEGIYLYSFKAWNAQGELVADYVPAVQKGTVPVVGFYDTVSKTFKTATAGTFAAGGEAVPTPDAPMDIVSNNGVLKLSPNLVEFNETRINSTTWATADKTKGFEVCADVYNKSVGNSLFSNANCFGVFVPCKLGESVSINFFDYTPMNTRCLYCEVDADGRVTTTPVQYISNIGILIESTFTLTQSDSIGFVIEWYISTSQTRNYTKENYMVVRGSTPPTKYMPYGQIYTDGTVETIEIYGDNLIDLSVITEGYYYDPQGNYVALSAARLTDYIPVEAGKDVKIYFKSLSTVSTLNIRINIFNSNKVWQSQDVLSLEPLSDGTKTITPTNNGYIRVSGNYSGGAIVDWNTASITESFGSATAEMLLKVGDYEDVQEILSGAVTRKVGVKVLDGTENWVASGNLFYAGIATDALEDTHSCYCTHFKGVTTNASAGYNNEIKVGTNATQTINWTRVQIYPVVGTYSNVTVFKQWLADQYAAGAPVIVVYPLDEPTTESVTGQTLQVQDGDNTLEITQAGMAGLELEVTYMKQGS